MKRPLQVLTILFIVAILSASLAFWQVNRVLDSPLTVAENGTVFEVRPGAAKVTTTISNSFGFGGTNGSLIFRAMN